MSKSSGRLLAPVRTSIEVPCPPEEAFRVFTARLDTWWPLTTYSVTGDSAVSCGMEKQTGGALFEIDSTGATHRWGTLNVWEPPNRLVIGWHPYGESGTATEIEVRFVDRGSSTLVELEHRNWEALGDQAAEKRSAYEGGWPGVLALFADSAGRPNTVPAGGAADGAS